MKYLLSLLLALPASASLPLTFEAAASTHREFVSRSGSQQWRLTPDHAQVQSTCALDGSAPQQLTFIGAKSTARGMGEAAQPGHAHYFSGTTKADWRTNVNRFQRVRYTGIYPGVDVIYYGTSGQLEYDLVLAPGTDPAAIRLRFGGTPKLLPDGGVAAGDWVQRRPVAFQIIDGHRRPVIAAFTIAKDQTLSFTLGAYDRTHALIIDPVVVSASGFGGTRTQIGTPTLCYPDVVTAMAVDGRGNTYLAGYSSSTQLPTTPNSFQPQFPTGARNGPAFVAKLDPTGQQLLYVTYLGGAGFASATGIAVDATGAAYITGTVSSRNFPVRGGIQGVPGGIGNDAFVAKLNPTGGTLVYSTYLGGESSEYGGGIAVDRFGFAYVVGTTTSANFPTTPGSLNSTPRPSRCEAPPAGSGYFVPCTAGFAAKLDRDGNQLLYSTVITGAANANTDARAVALDSQANAYFTGYSQAADFPVTPGASRAQCCGAYVAKLDSVGSRLVYATFLGEGEPAAIAVDSTGAAVVGGRTDDLRYPVTTGAYQTFSRGGWDLFISKLNPAGSALLFSTFLGGGQQETAGGLALDSAGNVYVTGSTTSLDFPTLRAFQSPANSGKTCPTCALGQYIVNVPCTDGFVAKLDASGRTLLYSSYLGGTGQEFAAAVGVDTSGNAYVAGNAEGDFPFTSRLTGSIFVTKIDETDLRTPLPSATAPRATAAGIVNAASFQPGLTPGGLVTIFGTNLSNTPGITRAATVPLPRTLDGITVAINDIPAPLLAVINLNGQEQINLQVPLEIDARQNIATVTITRNGVSTAIPNVPVFAIQPALLTGAAQSAVAQHSSYETITPENPARAGEVITLYATGLGAVEGTVRTGEPAPSDPLPRTRTPILATVSGFQAETLYIGLVPGSTGLYQVNLRIPEQLPTGNVPVLLTTGAVASNVVLLPTAP